MTLVLFVSLLFDSLTQTFKPNECKTIAGVSEYFEILLERNIEGIKMECDSQEPEPSTSTSASQPSENPDNEINVDKELNKLMTVEDFLLKSKTYMLDYEKHMFLDTIDSDCLVVTAR